jgi:hypothetical protein
MKKLVFIFAILSCQIFVIGRAEAQFHITSYLTSGNCLDNQILINTNLTPASYSYKLRLYYGDGSSEILSFDSSYTGFMFHHTYEASGYYTVKAILLTPGGGHIDSISFSKEYVPCRYMPLKFYNDDNGNCDRDNNEMFIYSPIKLEVDSNGRSIDTITVTSGIYYGAKGNIGDIYAFKIMSLPGDLHSECPASGVILDTLQSATINSTKYVGLRCGTSSTFDLSAWPIIPVSGIRDEWGNIYIFNPYCNAVNSILTLTHSPNYSFGWSNQTPASISGNTVTWNINSLSTVKEPPYRIYYVLLGAGYLKDRDTVHSYVTVSPITGDVDPTNNAVEVVDTVNASSDPNEMLVFPGGNILSGSQLQYAINFENVGRDTAFNIHIMDTLSDYLDAKSLEIVAASGVMNISRIYDNTYHNIYKFDFPSINLLDSSHHGQCDGMVILNIKTKTGLANGTEILNRAGVYFDDNGVVMTNTVENIIGWPADVSSVSSSEMIYIYPNPVKSNLIVQVPINFRNVGESFPVAIQNAVGQVVYIGRINSGKTEIDVSGFYPGVYFIKVNGELQKFVKE